MSNSLVVRVGANIKDFQKEMKNITRHTNIVGEELAKIGKGMSKKMTVPLLGLATANVGAAASFEYSMSKVATTTGATGQELEKLQTTARDWGRNSVFNANEVASAMSQMGLAGLDTTQIYDALPATIALAQSANMDLAEATSKMTGVLNIFNKEGQYAGLVADMMTSANKTTNATISEIQQTLQNASSAIGRYNVSLEDSMIITTLLADANQTGATAGTAMRSMLDDLAQACRNNNEAMQELGVAFHDVDGNARPTMDVVRDLREAFDGMSAAQRDAKLESMGISQTAMPALVAMLEACDERLDYLSDRFDDVTGSAQHYADIMGDNLKTELKIFWNNVRDIGIEIGDVFLPVLRDLMQRVIEIASTFAENLTPEMAGTIVKIGAIVAAIGPLLVIVGKAMIFFGKLKAALVILKGAFAGLTVKKIVFGVALKAISVATTTLKVALFALKAPLIALKAIFTIIKLPIVLVIAKFAAIGVAIAALIAGVIYLWKNWEEVWTWIKDFAATVWEGIKNIFAAVGEWFYDTVIIPVSEFFVGLWQSISDAASAAWGFIVGVWEVVAEWFNNIVVQPIMDVFRPIVQWFIELFTEIWDYIASVFEVIGVLAYGCWQIIVAVWELAAEWFNDNVVQPVRDFFKAMWEGIGVAASAAWDFISGVWDAVSEWFNTSVITPVRDFFKAMWEGIRNAASTAWTNITGIWKAVPSWFNDSIITPVSNFFSQMWHGLKTGASGAWSAIQNIFGSVASWFKNVFQTAWEGVRNVFSTGGQIFSGIVDGITSAFTRVVNAIIRGLNRVIAMPFNAINRALDRIRGVSILGISPFSGLGSINVPQIPELRKGGVLKKGQMGLLEGDGAEAVVPLEKNREWIGKVTTEFAKQLDFRAVLADGMRSLGAAMTGKQAAVNDSTLATQPTATNNTTNDYRGMFEGAHFHINDEKDARTLAEELAWLTQRQTPQMG